MAEILKNTINLEQKTKCTHPVTKVFSIYKKRLGSEWRYGAIEIFSPFSRGYFSTGTMADVARCLVAETMKPDFPQDLRYDFEGIKKVGSRWDSYPFAESEKLEFLKEIDKARTKTLQK